MKSERPLIGMLCRHDLSVNYKQKPVNAQGEPYMKAVSQAGGIPFLIPLNLPETSLRTLYDLAEGIILTGGGDVEPSLYNHEPHPTQGDVQSDRDKEEITVVHWAAADGKPLLGICRGIQVIAVAAGGTLIQDIPSQMPEATLHQYHYNNEHSHPEDYLAHDVELTPTSRLAKALQVSHVWTNSLHHQAIQSVPVPWQIMGRSTDGVVEVVEHTEHPFLIGVQWHPEVLVAKHESARQIFTAFIQACQNKSD